MSDFTLSDGTVLPKGAFIAANANAKHYDETCYDNPEKFDGFRFSRMREASQEEGMKHQMLLFNSYLAYFWALSVKLLGFQSGSLDHTLKSSEYLTEPAPHAWQRADHLMLPTS